MDIGPALSTTQAWRYGLMGLPLAFVALPLYVLLPNYYAREFQIPLAALGAVLLATRLLDALVDPYIGRWSDRLFRHSTRAVLWVACAASLMMALALAGLFMPLTREPSRLLAWSALLLMLTYASFSTITVAHQSWGALLGGDAVMQSRLVAWREGLGLLGVVLASVAPLLLGLPATVLLFALALLLGWLAWWRAPRPQTRQEAQAIGAGLLWQPWRRLAFRQLLLVFMLNGTASAVPATLVLFFVQDRLQVAPALEPVFLASYFLCAAASMPLWLRGVRRYGLARCWLGGMLLAVAVFVWASQLGAGDALAFALVCMGSGLALGADLALPGAMLAGLVARSGDLGQSEGTYFGWWNFATKLNLALAAGLALPLLGWFGYAPGGREPAALQALTVAYCLLPSLLKLSAAALLYRYFIHRPAALPDQTGNS